METFHSFIPENYYLDLGRKSGTESCCIIAVHISWIRELISVKRIPAKFTTHDTLTSDQVKAFLGQGKCEPLGPFWIFLHLTTHSIPNIVKTYKSLSSQNEAASGQTQQSFGTKTWPQILDFIGEANFKYTWEQPYISLLDRPQPIEFSTSRQEQVQSRSDKYFENVLNLLYNHKNFSSSCDAHLSAESTRFSIANLVQPVSILKHQKCFLIFQLYSEYSLQDCVSFSPQKLSSSNLKQLFVLYQILQFLRDWETLNIPTGNLILSDIWTDECLCIIVRPNLSEILDKLEADALDTNAVGKCKRVEEFLKHCVNNVKCGGEDKMKENISPELVESTIRHWCEGWISNYDYLMFLNYLSDRVCNVNPNHHPVFPWVCDFSTKSGGWRDLTKSKFRLNKGERQLDLMFEEKGGANTIPHHVTDILSEITYYVYKARQTPKEVLCKFVRPKWVPAEYPVSIARMQEWTPDECIPEFYDDPSIFQSIHSDLPDLQPSPWAKSPQDFIEQHRKLLESDHVSSKLHHWIDLTFGYKLSGNAAIKSKNIYLSLVDNHQNLVKNGVIQLFQTPHPPRRSTIRNLKNTVTYSELKRMRESSSSLEKDIISLPRKYDSMGFLDDFEVCLNFFSTHFSNTSNIALKGIKDLKVKPSDSIKLFGCLLVELVLPNKVHYIAKSVRDINMRFEFYKKIIRNLEPLPIFVKRTIQTIFTPNETLEFFIPLDISVDLLLLSGGLSPIPFPKYFEPVYKLVRSLRNFDSSLRTADPVDSNFRSKVEELKVKSFSRDLIQILCQLDEEGLTLILPFILELFRDPTTRVLAVWNLFHIYGKSIGREKSINALLHPIIQIYESDYNSDKHLKLFHRSFLLQLMSCFGLKVFLDNFITLIIEAIGGWKHLEDKLCNSSIITHLKGFEEIIEEVKNKPIDELPREEKTVYNSGESFSEGSTSDFESEIFIMEPDQDSEDDNPNLTPVSGNSPSLSGGGGTGEKTSTGPGEMPFDSRNSKSTTENDITEMCCETVIWLMHRLGPVLCARYISKNLLRVLTLCYFRHLDLAETSGTFPCHGDKHVGKVLECLIAISDLYGDCFIERQYIPYAVEVVASATKKMSFTLEAALIGVSSLLELIFNHLDDSLLLALLNETILPLLLKPIIHLVTSVDIQFPSGDGPRRLLVNKILNMLGIIRRKIGPDISVEKLKPLILELCGRLTNIPIEVEDEAKVKQNWNKVFDISLAYLIYTNFYDMLVGSEFEVIVRDILVRTGQTPVILSDSSPAGEKSNEKKRVEHQSSFGSRSFGNRIFVQENEAIGLSNDSSSGPPKDTTRHLKGNWLLYWDHEIGRSSSKFNFKQIKLQTFSGHSASVRSICSLQNENSFLTGSKDKTCRVFSLRNQGDESTICSHKWTYTHHKKAVLSVLFNEPLHMAASTDGHIHMWDPFVGKIIRVLDTNLGKNICCLKSIENCSSFIGAGVENFVTVVDPRTSQAYELKMGTGQNAGLVRCAAVTSSGTMVIAGHSSGVLSTLDLRHGNVMASWKGHEGEVLQLITHKDQQLISTSFDQNISVWNLEDHRLNFHMRGPTEPVHSLTTYESELITCTTSNRIGVHNRIDQNSDFSSTRLRHDAFRGIVTTFNLLPLNKMLLVGSDSGLVHLLC